MPPKPPGSNVVSFLQDLAGTALMPAKLLLRSRPLPPLPHATTARAFVLGNGPSLKPVLEKYASQLAQEELYVVNRFAATPEFQVLKPQNYVITDNGYQHYKSPKGAQFKKELITIIEETYQGLAAADWPIRLFLPIRWKNSWFCTQLRSNSKWVQFFYLNHVVAIGFPAFRFFLYARNWATPPLSLVLNAALNTGITRKHSEIYLLGADHDWHKSLMLGPNNEIWRQESHFYNEETKPFDSRLIPGHAKRMHEFFERIAIGLKSFDEVSDFARRAGVQIINASDPTFVDAFPRKPLDQILR